MSNPDRLQPSNMVGWPRAAGRIRRPVAIRALWLYGLDTPPARHMTMAQMLGMPGAWTMLMAGMRQNPIACWTDQPPAPRRNLPIPYVKNGAMGYCGPNGEFVPEFPVREKP